MGKVLVMDTARTFSSHRIASNVDDWLSFSSYVYSACIAMHSSTFPQIAAPFGIPCSAIPCHSGAGLCHRSCHRRQGRRARRRTRASRARAGRAPSRCA